MKTFQTDVNFEIEGRGTVFVFGEEFPAELRKDETVCINGETYRVRDVEMRRSGIDGSVAKGFALLVGKVKDTAPTDPPPPRSGSASAPA